MSLFLKVFAATLDGLRERVEIVSHSVLLRETFALLNGVAAPHWMSSDLMDVPDMVRDLARDRDDYKRLSESYKHDLIRLEADLRARDEFAAALKESEEGRFFIKTS